MSWPSTSKMKLSSCSVPSLYLMMPLASTQSWSQMALVFLPFPFWTILLVLLQDSVTNKANVLNGILGVIGKVASTFHSGKSAKKHDEDFLRELNSRFTSH